MLHERGQNTVAAHSELFDGVEIWLAVNLDFVHHWGHETHLVVCSLVPNCATGEPLLRRIYVVYKTWLRKGVYLLSSEMKSQTLKTRAV